MQRMPLKARDFEVDLESNLGKTAVVSVQGSNANQAGGYACSFLLVRARVCACEFLVMLVYSCKWLCVCEVDFE